MIRLDKLRKDAGRMTRLGRLLAPHARPHARLAAGGLGLSLALLVFHLAQPWPLKWIFDALSGRLEGLPFLADAPGRMMAVSAGLFLAVSAAAAAAEYGQLLILNGLGNRVVFGFRTDLFRHLLRQPLAFHEKREVGELLTRVVSDTARLRRGLNGLLLRVAQTLALFVATLAMLVWLNPGLAAVAGAAGLLCLALMTRTGRRILKAARKQRQREGRLAAVVEESLTGIRDLQTYRPDGAVDPRFDRQNDRSLRSEQKVRRMEALLHLRVSLLLAVSVCAVLGLGAAAVGPDPGSFSPGDLILFMTYVVALYRPFTQFSRESARAGRTMACADRLVKLMERKPAIDDAPDAVPADALQGGIAFEGVAVRAKRRRLGGRRKILQDVSFRAAPGERIAVLGPNGAGKSSLLLLLARLADPKKGRVLADDRDLRSYRIASWRRNLSVVHQDAVFFGLSVRENITLGAADVPEARVREAVARAKAAELVERLPGGYDTVIRRRGRLLSGGERQRLAVARALARDGRIWLLDEPATGLDAAAEADLTDLLLEVTRGRTTFWITHDVRTARRLDRVLLLTKGRVAYDGPSAGLNGWLEKARNEAENPALRRYYEQLLAG